MNNNSQGVVLGLNYSGVHDTAVALVKPTGEVISACSLERLTRVKQDSRPPDPLLEKLPWERIETIAVSTDQFALSPLNPRSQLHPTPLTVPRAEFLMHGQPFYDCLSNLPKPLQFVCHHVSHAACAFWLSGFDEALCLTYDGGMFNSPWFGGLYRASRTEGITALDRFTSSHYAKITSLYSIVTGLLGFTPNKHEGKITGLAAYGKPTKRLRAILDKLFTTDYLKMEGVAEWFHGYSRTSPSILFVDPVRKEELFARFKRHSREDIAATLQAMAEEHVTEILWRARELNWRSDAICLSGGLFANVKINQRVKEFGFREIFIAPPMTDDGTALGAALAVVSERRAFRSKSAATMFLGPWYSSKRIQASLQKFELSFTRLKDPEECLAEYLAQGAIIGIFQGKMEFGPRALGNRSILSQATDPDINSTLNARLRRTEFMPFAPITRLEDASECYIGLDGAEHTAEFMTITCQCTEAMRSQSPAVVHVDGTARPQLVRCETHPLIHAILSAYQRKTGIASLINTSFNVHEEPIVCSPSDAIRGFLETGIDFLYLEGGFLVSFKENLPAAVKCLRHALAQPTQDKRNLASQIKVLSERITAQSTELQLRTSQFKERDARIGELERVAEERLAGLNSVTSDLGVVRHDAEERERGLHDFASIVAARDARIGELERVAEERLAGLNSVTAEIEGVRHDAEERERGLHEFASIVAARDARIGELERVAEERLAGLNSVTAEIEGVRHDAEERERGLHEFASIVAARDARIGELERVAEERLAGLNSVTAEIEGVRHDAEERERGLHEFASIVAARDARIGELERVAEERLAGLNSVTTEIEGVRRDAEERERGLHEFASIVAARDARIGELERVAEERLAGLNSVTAEIEGVRREAKERERGLHEFASIVAARDARIGELERVAEERLAGLNSVTAEIEGVRREAKERERGLHEFASIVAARDARIGELERVAEERLAGLNSVTAEIEGVRREAKERERGLHEFASIVAARDARIGELERVAEERSTVIRVIREQSRVDETKQEKALHDIDLQLQSTESHLAEVIAWKAMASQQLSELEHETLVRYLVRRLHKLKG